MWSSLALPGRERFSQSLTSIFTYDHQGMKITSPETSNEILQPTENLGFTEPTVQIDNSSESTCWGLPSMVSKPWTKPGVLIPVLISIQERNVPPAYRHVKSMSNWSAGIEINWQEKKKMKYVIGATVSKLNTCAHFPLPLITSNYTDYTKQLQQILRLWALARMNIPPQPLPHCHP